MIRTYKVVKQSNQRNSETRKNKFFEILPEIKEQHSLNSVAEDDILIFSDVDKAESEQIYSDPIQEYTSGVTLLDTR